MPNIHHLAARYSATRALRNTRKDKRVKAALAKQEAQLLSTIFFGD